VTAMIESDDHRRVVVATVSGDLDIVRAPEVRAQLGQVMTNQAFGLVVDLSDTSYLDSAGVNLLFDLAERLENRQLKLAVVLREGSMVAEVARLVDLSSGMSIHGSRDAAVAEIGGS
jgi:anti-sigma B factor antagonist